MDYISRRKWLSNQVKLFPVKRITQPAQNSRSDSRYLTLPLPNFSDISVCRKTVLSTLGYNNDSVIMELVAASKKAPCGGKVKECSGGSHKPLANRDLIKNHIESFKPCVSHYIIDARMLPTCDIYQGN